MKKALTRKTNIMLLLTESVLNLLALPLSLASVACAAYLMALSVDMPLDLSAFCELAAIYTPEAAAVLMFLLFLVMAAVRLIRGFVCRIRKPRAFFSFPWHRPVRF